MKKFIKTEIDISDRFNDCCGTCQYIQSYFNNVFACFAFGHREVLKNRQFKSGELPLRCEKCIQFEVKNA